MFTRNEFSVIKQRVEEPRHFIQVVLGPRQIGKTTVVKKVLEASEIPSFYFSAASVNATDMRLGLGNFYVVIIKKISPTNQKTRITMQNFPLFGHKFNST